MFTLQTRDSEGLFHFERSDAHYKLLHSSFYCEVMQNLKSYFDNQIDNDFQFVENDMESECEYILLEDETDKYQRLERHKKFLSVCYDYINKQKSTIQDLKFQPDYFKS